MPAFLLLHVLIHCLGYKVCMYHSKKKHCTNPQNLNKFGKDMYNSFK